MRVRDAVVGARVRSKRAFQGVPKATEGLIDEDYDTGVMVAWDLRDRPLPANWRYTGQWAGKPGVPLRDGFDKLTELHHLEVV